MAQRTPSALKLAAVPVVLAALAGGVWVAGGAVTDDMDLGMALTAAWFAVAGVACLLVVRARRDLLVPVAGTFAVAVVAIGGYLGYSSLVDQEVDEDVVVGVPAGEAQAAGTRNVQIAAGEFVGGAHPTSGTAAVVELPGGRRVVTLTGFQTDPGPDLRVYLASDRDASESEDLGALKGNIGDQQYDIPDGVDLARLDTVVIWCRAFSVEFGNAELRPS